MYDFTKHRFRCSSLGYLFTETRGDSNLEKYNKAVAECEKLKAEYQAMSDTTGSGKPSAMKPKKLEAIKKQAQIILDLEPIKHKKELAATVKKHLIDVYAANQHGLTNDKTNKYLEKGTLCEEDSITLYCRVKKVFLKNNTIRLFNEHIQGEIDLFEGESITTATHVVDTKTSWDHITFHRNLVSEVKAMNFYQGQGYMSLTGARKYTVANCLVNTPPDLIEQAITNFWWKMGRPDRTSDSFAECEREIIRNMTFDHIPMAERIIEINVEWDGQVIEKLQDELIPDARKFLVSIQQERMSLSA